MTLLWVLAVPAVGSILDSQPSAHWPIGAARLYAAAWFRGAKNEL